MSTIIIVSVCAAIAAVIGLRVYLEDKNEKELEKLKQQVEEDKKRAILFAQEEVIAAHQPVAIEEKPENQPVSQTPTPAFVEVENINSAASKPKKRYYHKKKKVGPKQTKNKNK